MPRRTKLSECVFSKVKPSGNYLWAKHFGDDLQGADNLAICAGLAVDAAGNSFITGRFYGTVDFDPVSNREFLLTSNGADDCFVARFTSDRELFRVN